jgi:hypothetical protein
MPGVCRPENQTPRAASFEVAKRRTGGTRDIHPKAESSQSSKQRHFPPFVPANCSILRRTQTPSIHTYTTVKRHQPNGGTPRLLVHYTQTHVGQVYKQPAAMAYMQMSVSSSETIGRSQRIVHAPTHDLSRVIEIDVVSARPPHDILDRNYCHALAAAWLCVCVCSASRQPNKYVFIQRYAASTPAERESGVCMGCARPLSCRQFMG